jgi:hypothetical protein
LFDEYAEKLKKITDEVPAIFKKVAKRGAIKFVNTAKKRTDDEHLVDTGNYKRNWFAEQIEPLPDTYGVVCENNVEYASFLERGTGRGIKGRFVGELSLNDARFFCLEELDKKLDKSYKQK